MFGHLIVMTINRFELILDKDSNDYYIAGEEIKGTIEISVLDRVRIARLSIRLFGNVQTAWRNKLVDQIYESKEYVLDEYKDMTSEFALHCNEMLEILKGEHNLSFTMKLPLDVISTIKKENYGFVKYNCLAVLDVPQDGGSEIIAESEFCVVSYLNVDAPHFKKPVESREQVSIIGFCCRRLKGFIRAKVIVAELGLLPGETVKITIIVENTVQTRSNVKKKHKGVHQCALLSLCQQIDFKAKCRSDPHLFDHRSLTTAVKSYGTCRASQTKGPETKSLYFDIPNGLPPTSANETCFIVCSYFFRLDMEHFDVIVPVVIGSQKTLDKISPNHESSNS